MRIALKIYFIHLFIFTDASKCPEIRKPHVKSCVIFYNCINLPEGGYVWAPFKCTDGLVFQPSLRICVLPGDTWTCSDVIDHSLHQDETFHTTKLIDKTKTIYDELITHDNNYSTDISHNIDSSYNLGNLIKTIPYPLIKINDNVNKNNNHQANSIKRDDNDLLNVNHNDDYIPVAMIKVNDNENNKLPDIKSFMNGIFFYQYFAPSLKQQTFVSSPVINNYSTLINSERMKNNLLNYLVENYIFNHKSNEIKSMDINDTIINIESTTSETKDTNLMQSNFIPITEKNKIDIYTIDELNNILVINGNLGHKEYITVEKYKLLSNEMNIDIIDVIPCIQAQRLPNFTDCTRYYTCDPTSAKIHEFICPSNTAFNNQMNLCDRQKYKLCRDNRNTIKPEKTPSMIELQKIITTNKIIKDNDESFTGVKLCETTGKFPDVTSDKFYYLCYSLNNSDKIESYRMACPNNLIFCNDKKVCTAKRLCINYN